MRLALLGRKLGRKVIVVVEQLSELRTMLRLAQRDGRRAADRRPRSS